MNSISKASQLFRDGCACSQAILVTYAQPLGLSREMAMRISAGFAGGMRMGATCGAVTGALMVLGLRHASEKCATAASRADVYARVVEFTKKFRQRNGSVICSELLKCDIGAPAGIKQAREQGLFRTTCVKMVESAAGILEEMGTESRDDGLHDGG